MPNRQKSHKVILGIDPGYDRLGIAILEKTDKEKLLYSDCFQTNTKDAIYVRLGQVGAEINRVITKFQPNILAIENLFITKNQKTAMRVSEARGIILYECLKNGLDVFEYTPMEIKSAICGDGKSDKTRIIKMVHLLLKLPEKNMLDDEYDAIAAALTHSAVSRS